MNDPLTLSKKIGGKIEIKPKIKLTKDNISVLYTPGVAQVAQIIARDHQLSFNYTIRKNTIAIISDGSAVLGLGNIGPEAALPVMEGKSLLFKELGGVDAFPLVLGTQNPKEIIKIVEMLSPTFGGINLEDISAPRCFMIEQELVKKLAIPVFHDDQHGTAIIVLAGLINSLKVVKKSIGNVKIVISGAGAAGIAIAKLLLEYGSKNILLADTQGAIFQGRKQRMNWAKKEIAKLTNKSKERGSLANILIGADIFIGVSGPNLIGANEISKMSKDAIVFAMSNPQPEISPKEAKKGGAMIIATGRSDYPNQINNALVFPGIFKGALEYNVKKIRMSHKIMAAETIAKMIKNPNYTNIVPGILDKRVPAQISKIFKQ